MSQLRQASDGLVWGTDAGKMGDRSRFTFNDSPNRYGLEPFYALPVWAWRDNPHGTFVDWNPRVSCAGFTANQGSCPRHSLKEGIRVNPRIRG
jgi:hypothetical protein